MFKKLLAILMAVLMIMGTMTAFSAVSFASEGDTEGTTTTETNACPGVDLDNSGAFNVADVAVLLNELAHQTEEAPSKYDFDGNGKLSIEDISVVLNALAGGYTGEHTEGDECLWCGYSVKTVAFVNVDGDTQNAMTTTTAGTPGFVLENGYYAKDVAILTVTTQFGATTIQNTEGKYLSTYATGGNVFFTDKVTEYCYWTLEAQATENVYVIKNNAALYKGTTEQYLEYFAKDNVFKTYSWNNNYATAYPITFIDATTLHTEHNWENTTVSVENCEDDGYILQTCPICNDTRTIDTTPATGHKYVDGKCEVCDVAEPDAHTHTFDANHVCTGCNQLEEGDYIVYGTHAMPANIISSRLDNDITITVTDGTHNITDAAVLASITWHIAINADGYYTFYNASTGKYAAGTGANNKAQLISDATNTFAQWNVIYDATTGTFVFENVGNKAAGKNYTLRNNGAYGFAPYNATTGTAPALLQVKGSSTHTHTWSEAGTEIKATCTSFGTITYTCTVEGCEATNVVKTPASLQSFIEISNVPQTCEVSGSSTQQCEYCETTRTIDTLPANGHNVMYGMCWGCYEQMEAPVEDCAHEWDETTLIEATCSSFGKIKKACGLCGEVKEELTYCAEHEYGEESIVSEKTCTEDGVKKHTCVVCATTEIYYDYSYGHNYQSTVAVPGTCVTEGTRHFECTECGDSYDEPYYGDHVYGEEGVVTTPAGCTTSGVMTYTCTVCPEGTEGHTTTATIEATGHNVENGVCSKCQVAGTLYEQVTSKNQIANGDKIFIVGTAYDRRSNSTKYFLLDVTSGSVATLPVEVFDKTMFGDLDAYAFEVMAPGAEYMFISNNAPIGIETIPEAWTSPDLAYGATIACYAHTISSQLDLSIQGESGNFSLCYDFGAFFYAESDWSQNILIFKVASEEGGDVVVDVEAAIAGNDYECEALGYSYFSFGSSMYSDNTCYTYPNFSYTISGTTIEIVWEDSAPEALVGATYEYNAADDTIIATCPNGNQYIFTKWAGW